MPSFHYSCFHSLIRTLSLLFLLTEIFSSITKRYVLYSFYAHVFGLSYSSLFPLRSVYLQFLLSLLPFFGDFFFLFNDYYVKKYNLEYGLLVFFFYLYLLKLDERDQSWSSLCSFACKALKWEIVFGEELFINFEHIRLFYVPILIPNIWCIFSSKIWDFCYTENPFFASC